jgi:hypothetical protein
MDARNKKRLCYNLGLIGMRESLHVSNVYPSISVNKTCRSYGGQRTFGVVYGEGRDSAVGIPTRYGLGGPGIEPRWVARFSTPVQICSGLPILLCSG